MRKHTASHNGRSIINYERARPVHAACLDNPHVDSAAKPAGTSTRFSLPRTRDKKVVCLRFLYTLIAGCDAKSSAARSISPARIAFTPIRPWARYAIALLAQRSAIISYVQACANALCVRPRLNELFGPSHGRAPG